MSEDQPDYKPEDLVGMFAKGIDGYKKEKSDQAETIRVEQARVFNKPEQQEQFINRYIKLDSWNLYSEALPILIGYRPEYINYAKLDRRFKELEKLARSSANITLKIINKDEPENKWRVIPKDVVKWAQSKEVEILMLLESEFGLDKKQSRQSDEDKKDHGNAELNAIKREALLHAALGALVAFPEECKTHGKITASAIAKTIEQNSKIWFDYDDLPLSNRKTVEIISKAIKSAQK
jgi:hypothetical protein